MEKAKICKSKNCMHCRYCGKPILWQKGCKDNLKDLVSGNMFMQLCNGCIERIARYWLGLHGI